MDLSRRCLIRTSILTAGALSLPAVARGASKTHFKLAWTVYAGWMPWPWAADQGIVKKWADRYGITIDVVQINDYAESINQYTAGAFDALTVTNMDALAVPAVGGVDTTAIIIGDFSNGNDAVILKDKTSLAAIRGQKVNLVQFSVSHYLLDRALSTLGMSERDVTVVNTSDADMSAAWHTPEVTAAVTWNPIVGTILEDQTAHRVFDSSQIPGEIMDTCVVNTATLRDNPRLGDALAGIWYETLKIMTGGDAAGQAARAAMGKASGTDLAGFEKQLATTRLFVDPIEAAKFAVGPKLPATMRLVRDFLFDHGLLGQDAQNADVVGIGFADGSVLGHAANVKLRFVDTYMKGAASL